MSGFRLRPYLGPLIALLVVLAIGAGTVYAAIPNQGTYSACLTKSTGAIKVINYPKVKCARGQQLIKWSQQGPAGPQGAQGPRGDQGPAGPADWNAIPNKPAGFADGVDDVGGYVTATVPCPNPVPGGGYYVTFSNLPRNMLHDFQLVPTNAVGVFLYITRVEWLLESDGELEADVLIDDFGSPGTGTCNLRRISFTEGISVASAKKELKQVKVGYSKKHARR